jgi:competence protein ComEC
VCDVGQGDGLALSTGPHSAVVVDTGPDPALEKKCLDSLQITTVPLLILTHFHADHVDGISGVFDGRKVAQVLVTRLQDPPEGVQEVAASTRGVPTSMAYQGEQLDEGPVHLSVLWPLPDSPTVGPGDGSTANEASIVALAETHGLRILLTGDVEQEGQAAIAATYPGLTVDVLKVPHHGSRYQDFDWLASLHAQAAIISVGIDNDYGHPAPETISALTRDGDRVWRTDHDGTVAVVKTDAGFGIVSH